ncbi:multiprotein-bridging factor 1 family protein [Geodermatophilus sp. SYSU D00742]
MADAVKGSGAGEEHSGAATSVEGQRGVVGGDLGRVLRQRRIALRRRAEDLAAEVGVTAAYVRMIERGARVPARDVAAQLLRAVDLEPGPAQDRADFEIEVGGQRMILEMKSSPARERRRGPDTGSSEEAVATPLRDGRRLDRAGAGGAGGSDAELLGRLVRSLASMTTDELQAVAAAVDSLVLERGR